MERQLACWLVAAAIVGCDKDETSDAPSEGVKEETVDAGELCKLVAGAAQQNLDATCTDAEKKDDGYRYLTELAKERAADCTRWVEADAKGERVIVPAKTARACAAALEKQSWKDLLQVRSIAVVPECRDLLVGKQKPDEPCRIDGSCVAGHFCSGANDGIEGKCKQLVKAKEPCDARPVMAMGWAARGSCAEGLRCVVKAIDARHPLGFDGPEPVEEPVEEVQDAGPRAEALKEAREFGMIGLINAGDANDRWSGIDRIVRGLKGAEADPLAPSEGIGLGNVGGFGSGHGRLGGRAKGPTVRMGALTVSGRLPPEVIQRIARQNFARFRQCYEKGLAKNDKLQGRIVVRFVIGRDGTVSKVEPGGDITDTAVVECVKTHVTGLTFPQPEGGIVTVSLPIQFDPPGSAAPSASADASAENTCQASPKDELAGAGSKCKASSDCAAGLYCKRKGESGSCTARKKDGEACSSSLQCTGICGKDEKCASFCDGR